MWASLRGWVTCVPDNFAIYVMTEVNLLCLSFLSAENKAIFAALFTLHAEGKQ